MGGALFEYSRADGRRVNGSPRLLTCALITTALSCAPSAERSHLVLLTEGIPPTLDPLAALDSRVDTAAINLYSALVQYVPGTTDLQLDLAASYELSHDARRYVFNLREEALFHDGTPVLAEDVKYIVDRMLALKIGVWAYLTPVSGAEVLDERRVAIDLSEPFAGFLGAMTRLYIANADLIRANEFEGDFGQRWLQNHEARNGPYRLVSFQPEQRFTVERFPDYHLGWGSRHVERAVFRVLRDEAIIVKRENSPVQDEKSKGTTVGIQPLGRINSPHCAGIVRVLVGTQSYCSFSVGCVLVGRDEAFEFLEPVEDDIDLCGPGLRHDGLQHQEPMSVWIDIVKRKAGSRWQVRSLKEHLRRSRRKAGVRVHGHCHNPVPAAVKQLTSLRVPHRLLASVARNLPLAALPWIRLHVNLSPARLG